MADVTTGGGWALAVDLGTTGLKVGAVAEDGTILASGATELETTLGRDGAATQDPAQWWREVVRLTRALLADGVAADACVAVGTTGQWASTVPVDSDGEPVGPCLLWADDRGGRWSAKAIGGPVAGYDPRAIVPFLRYTGGAPSPNGADPTGHALYLRHEEPDVAARAAVLLEPIDYLGLRFTGRPAATPASVVAWWLIDNRPGRPRQWVPRLVSLTGRDPAQLPELLPSASRLGGLSDQAAAELGLPAGVPVVTGVADFVAAWAGSGSIDLRQAHFTISTTSWVCCAVPFKKTDIPHQIASVPGIRPDEYLVVNNHETAGACLQWLRDALANPTLRDLGAAQLPDYEELLDLAADSEPGAGGVLFTPWLKGERSPVDDRDLRAAFLNLGLDTRRADLVRSVLEGVAHNLRWLLEYTDTFAGGRLEPLRALGGGVRSDLWCQIHADVTGRTVERVADPVNAQLRGTAMVALHGLGRLDLAEAAARVPVDRVFRPDPAVRDRYEKAYAAYTSVYSRLKPVYRSLNRG